MGLGFQLFSVDEYLWAFSVRFSNKRTNMDPLN